MYANIYNTNVASSRPGQQIQSAEARAGKRKVLITAEKVIIKSCQNCFCASTVEREVVIEGHFARVVGRLNTLPCSGVDGE